MNYKISQVKPFINSKELEFIKNPIKNINGKLNLINNMLIIDSLTGKLLENTSKSTFSIPIIGTIANIFNNDKINE